MYQNRQLSGVTLCFIYTVFAVVIVFTVVTVFILIVVSRVVAVFANIAVFTAAVLFKVIVVFTLVVVFTVVVVFDNIDVVFYSQWYLCFKKILLCLQWLFYLHWLSECMQAGMPEGLTDAFTTTRPTIWGKKEIVQTIIEFIHFWERTTIKKAYKRKQQKKWTTNIKTCIR